MPAGKRKQTSWGNVAPWYQASVQNAQSYQHTTILPKLLALLSLKRGMRLLDIACGQGFFAHAFAQAGVLVSGYDIAPELIALAQKDAGPQETFAVAPSHKLPVKSKTFDAVTIILALQNIEQWKETIREASRVVRDRGMLVIVLNHPAFRIPRMSGWGYDAKRDVQYRSIERYLSDIAIKIDMHPGEKDIRKKEYTTSFHRPMSAYANALRDAGFSVESLEEWISSKKSQVGPRQKAEDRARKEIPLFMAIVARKNI